MTAPMLLCPDCGALMQPRADHLPWCAKCGGEKLPTRFHRLKQDNGRGFAIVRQDEPGARDATVIASDMTEAACGEMLLDLRAAEVLSDDYSELDVDAELRAAGGDPDEIVRHGRAVVAAALVKRRERAS